MNTLAFVNPIVNKNVNYLVDQKQLIEKAIEISNGDPIHALQYIVTCMNHEGYNVEFELVFTIPSNCEVTVTLPIKKTNSKDSLGHYVIWNDGIIDLIK